jgi:hypothetical protein
VVADATAVERTAATTKAKSFAIAFMSLSLGSGTTFEELAAVHLRYEKLCFCLAFLSAYLCVESTFKFLAKSTFKLLIKSTFVSKISSMKSTT